VVGIPILTSQFADLRLVVEFAYGVPPGTDGPWTDVTADLRASGVSIIPGRGDEASKTQPAQCGFILGNASGNYSRGPQSPNTGLRKNMPCRVRVLLNGVTDLEFQGETVGLTPAWDDTGKVATAVVTAAGTLRRVEAGDEALGSAMRRYVLAQSGVVGYWPMEEGSTATTFASALPGGPAMTSSTGLPKPGSYSGFVASAGAPTLGAEMYTASCAGTGSVNPAGQIWMLVNIPPSTLTDQTRIASINVEGAGISRIDLLYGTASSGSFGMSAYSGTTLLNNTVTGVAGGANGQDVLLGIDWSYSISGLSLTLHAGGLEFNPGVTGSSLTGGGSSPMTAVDSIFIAPDSNCSGMSIGHLYMTNTAVGVGVTFTVPQAAIAFVGETPTDRITRLCAEQGVPVTVTGASVQTMGPQTNATFSALLRECESVDLGVLFDGFGPGLGYIARDSRENQQPTLILNAAAGDIVACDPLDDDFGVVNRFQASRTGGSTVLFEDTTSALSTTAIGDHPGSETINCQTDDYLAHYASFRVNLGEVNDYRYPSLLLAVHSAPRILAGWLATAISSRIDVKHLADVRVSQDPKDLSFMVEGWSQTITRETWTIAVNCTSYDPWRIAVWAQTTGDTGEFIARGDPDGSTVSGPVSPGAPSLTVATPSGPLWTTASDDFPLYLDVGGQQVTCTAISGASSPQTFTVTSTSLRIPDQAAVTVWRNPRLGL